MFDRAGVRVVAISVDEVEDSVALAGKLSINYPLLKDEGLKVAIAYGVAMQGEEIAVPAVFVVNAQKKIVYTHVGESVMDRPSVETILEEAKKAKDGSAPLTK
ncbi:MAG: redoxin domain-containing protein [Polyangiaceae bacterium]|nr:redoxin domain-containing protein [Polyangiaceae bacterium]